MALDRAALISGLANEFDKDKGIDVKLDKGNYISDTNSLDCTALGIPLENLKKTRAVLQQFKEAFQKESKNDPEVVQNLLHIENSIKCVEQVISEKLKQ